MATFNGLQRPDSMTVGLNISYTVPVGKISRVTATLSAYCTTYRSSFNNEDSTGSQTANASANSLTGSFILGAGDILSSTRVTGAGNTSVANNTFGSRAAEASSILTINGTNSLAVRAAASMGIMTSTAGFSDTITSSGAADASFIAEEYYG